MISARSIRARHLVNWELRKGEPELRLLAALKDSDSDFLDVGANAGVYSYCALNKFRRVIAVEAHPAMASGLRRIIKPDNQVLSLALSDRIGETTFHIPTRSGRDVLTRSSVQEDANPGFRLRTISVPMTTIDELDLSRLGVMKIDVEGHESAVLRGGIRTIETAKPTCIVECEERHNAGGVAQTFAFFDTMGYHGYFVHRGILRNVAEFDTTELQRPENAKSMHGKRSADYVNNFIFVHSENAAQLARIRQVFPDH